MIYFLVGHRGVGKTSLLERLKNYFPQSVCWCLDAEIERRHGAIKDIFEHHGESHFRLLETQVLQELLAHTHNEQTVFVALGAGFVGDLTQQTNQKAQVIWVQRAVDASEFIFLDRPTLNQNKKDLRLPKELFKEREARYQSLSHAEYLLPEGDFIESSFEKDLFSHKLKNVRGALTLLAHHLDSPYWKTWIAERMDWGVEFFELRDDLLTPEQMSQALDMIPSQNCLISFRDPSRKNQTLALCQPNAMVDWPYEWGEAPPSLKQVIRSYHSEAVTFDQDLQKLQFVNGAFKWSPVISTFEQLIKAHQWAQKNSERSLLPRSLDGRWVWYRLLQKDRQPLQFFREGKGSAKDQPSLLQWLQRDSRHKTFAAVLGSPVQHSWTPQFHQAFFKTKKMDVLAIDINDAEISSAVLDQLKDWGLRAAAVTSPLKSWAAEVVQSTEPINTLVWSDKDSMWHGTSTDTSGFLALVQSAEILFTRGKNAVIWGGGGVLPALKEILPLAQMYAAQTGRPRPHNSMVENPSALIWAGGDSIQVITSCHPAWRPERVIDLNYRSDSPARAYAAWAGAKYFSGAEMFIVQAVEQQKFWSLYE